MGGGGKKGGGSPEITDYFLSVDFGICHGPVDALTEFKVDDRSVWSGEITDQKRLTIYKPTLFGGPEKEGGVVGVIDFSPGTWEDELNVFRPYYLGKDIDEVPQYRGTCTALLRGLVKTPGENGDPVEPPSGGGGFFESLKNFIIFATSGGEVSESFYWASNLANIKPAAFRVRRAPKPPSFPADRRMIDGSTANPAAIILEVLTSDEFGMWAPVENIDIQSFVDAADILHDENFGLAFNWVKQEQIESFINLILNHIAGTVFISHVTGLVTIRLSRGGYDPEALPVLSPDNAKLETYKRRSWGETVNEVVVKWRNPVNEQEESVSVQDGANVAMQGSLVSTTVDLPGIRSPQNALRAAQRELQSQSTPLANIRIKVDRRVLTLEPSGLFRLNWDRYGISNMVFRVTKVEIGTLMDNEITLEAIEDVFGMPETAIFEDPGTEWEDSNEQPRPALADTAFTLPFYFLANVIGENEAQQYEYPSALAASMVVQDGADTAKYDLFTERPNNQGDLVKTLLGSFTLASTGELGEPLEGEVRSDASLINLIGGRIARAGAFVWIGKGTGEADVGELALIESRNGSTYTLLRGVLDTTPAVWPAGTDIWVFDDVSLGIDRTERSVGEYARYWACPVTSLGTLDIDDAPVYGDTLNDRAYLPYRPGNVRVNGLLFPTELDEADLSITWAHRDRMMETTTIQPFDAGNLGNPDVTYRVRIYDADTDDLITTLDNITGTSVSYTAEQEAADTGTVKSNIRVLVDAFDTDNGYSWQAVEYEFTRPVPLWNVGWGFGWGEEF